MSKKTEQSRISYNKKAFGYDTSKEGLYTAFHIKELSNTIDLSDGDSVLKDISENSAITSPLRNKDVGTILF